MIGSLVSGIGLKGVLLIGLLAAAAGAYWHYTVVKSERDMALQKIGALEVSIETQKAFIADQQASLEAFVASQVTMQATLNALNDNAIQSNEQMRKLNDVLAKHDLERLALAKPGLIESRINRGTSDILGMFESVTGGGSGINN